MRGGVCSFVCFLLIFSLQAPSQKKVKAKKQIEDPSSFLVTGVLLNEDGSPWAAKQVAVFPLGSEGKPLAFHGFDENGIIKLDNPHANTDAKGRFSIRVPRTLSIGDHKVSEHTVGFMGGGRGQNFVLLSHKETAATVSIKVDEKTKTVNLGEVTAK